MKKIFAFTLAIVLAFSVFALAGCNNGPKNLYEDFEEFDSYVSADSMILGQWKETSTTDEWEWTFFDSTTLHKTSIIDGVSRSTVCTFNYNDETGALSFYDISGKQEYAYNVVLSGKTMTWTSADNTETKTFEKK